MQTKLLTKNLVVGLILISAIAIIESCNSKAGNETAQKQKYIIPDSIYKSLEIDTVHVQKLVDALTLTGKVSSNEDNVVKIFPLVSGNIQDIKVLLGDYVKEGQELAVIRSSEATGMSTDLVNAESNLTVIKRNLDATDGMYKNGLASQKDLVSAQAAYTQAQAELNRVRKVQKINNGNAQGEVVVRAPISGFVVEKLVTNNMTIRSDNGNGLFTISNLNNVWVIANVYESNISRVHLGDEVIVTTLSYPGREFKGRVDKILNVLDPTNKVMKVRVVLSNPDYALKPEMFASVTVTSQKNEETMCVPSTALVFDHSQYYVLKFNNRNDVQITPVEIINTVGNKTFIASGVKPGDKIVCTQAILIYDALNS